MPPKRNRTRRRSRRSNRAMETSAYRATGVVSTGSTTVITAQSLNLPTGRGYRPVRAHLQLVSDGPALTQVQVMTGAEANVVTKSFEVLVGTTPRPVQIRWPSNIAFGSDTLRGQSIVELDGICLQVAHKRDIWFVVTVWFVESIPILAEACPTLMPICRLPPITEELPPSDSVEGLDLSALWLRIDEDGIDTPPPIRRTRKP